MRMSRIWLPAAAALMGTSWAGGNVLPLEPTMGVRRGHPRGHPRGRIKIKPATFKRQARKRRNIRARSKMARK